jgi:DNA-binding transcriptional regulator YhcF (GntR family)
MTALQYVTQVRLSERQRRYLLLVAEQSDMRVSQILRQLIDDALEGALDAAKKRGVEDYDALRLVLDHADVVTGSEGAELRVPAHGAEKPQRTRARERARAS